MQMAVSAVRIYEISTKFNFDFASIYYFYFFLSLRNLWSYQAFILKVCKYICFCRLIIR